MALLLQWNVIMMQWWPELERMGNQPMSSLYSLLTGTTTTKSLFDVMAWISLESGYTARLELDGVVLRLVERTP